MQKLSDPLFTVPQMDRGAFTVVDRDTIPPGATIFPCRFVLAIKSSELLKALHKARLVIGGHLDKLKAMLFHLSLIHI